MAKVYKDHLGNPTAGVGHLLSKEEQELYPVGTAIPRNVRNKWFEEDIKAATVTADKFLPDDVPEEVRDIVINMSFNMGGSRFNREKWPKLFKAIESEDWETAAAEMKNSKWYKQVGGRSKRLVSRMGRISNG